MPSLWPETPGPGALPTFNADVQQFTRVRQFDGSAGQEAANVFGNLSRQLGSWEDRAAEDVGTQQGKTLGLDPNYRPDGDESLMGIARRNAAVTTYGNNLEASARNALTDAYNQYQQLPQSQQTPDQLAKSFANIKADFDQNHVFDQVRPQFDLAFGRMSDAYLRGAQADQLKVQTDQARASFLTNQNSARDAALKVASIPTSSDANVASLVSQHDAAVDQAVDNGIYTAAQAVKIKADFKQDVLSQRVSSWFDNLPDAQKPAAADAFRRQFLTPASSGDAAAARNYLSSVSAHPDRPGDTSNMHPDFAVRLADAIREARGQGLNVGVESGFRAPGQLASQGDGSAASSYDAQGLSLHSYGAAADISGLGAANSPQARQWAEIAARHGIYNPYGIDNAREFNHWQMVPWKLEDRPQTLAAVRAAGGDVQKAWDAISPVSAGQVGQSTGGLDFDTASRVSKYMDASLRAQHSQASQTQKLALGDIGGDLKQMEAGLPVSDDEWSAKKAQYGASVDPVVADAFNTADRIRTLYQGFRGQTASEVESEVAALRGQVAQGATPQQARIVEAAEKYAGRLRKDLSSDPLSRAAADGVIAPPGPLDFSSPPALAQTLRNRVAAADQVRQHYGLGASPLLTPPDKENLKAVAAAGGEPMVQTAAAAAAALGPRAGEFLSQIGGDAPSFTQMGALAATGGDPGVMRDAAWAIQQDHQKGGKVQRPAAEVMQPAAVAAYGDALKAIPSFALGGTTLAANALAAQIAREGLDPKQMDQRLVQQTLQKAVGATYVGGVQYGGVTSFGGGQKVLAPADVRADQLGDVINAITDKDLAALPAPPRAADGSLMPAAALSGLHFTSLGPGVYALSKGDPFGEDPQWVTFQGGQRGASGRFVLDLNAMGPQLRARVPGAYK